MNIVRPDYMSFQKASEMLEKNKCNKQKKKLEGNTWLIKQEGYFSIRYHNTNIIDIYPDYIVLRNGGWFTRTTKDRLNSYTPFSINQHQYKWFVNGYPFSEGMKIPLVKNNEF
jgi:hypothetical protein